MKETNIEINFSKEKKTEILFSIGDKISIGNKTKAKAYSFKLKRLIKDTLFLLSNVQISVYTNYRKHYFYLPSNLDNTILRNIRTFDERISYVFQKYAEGNGSLIYSNIDVCFNSVFSSIDFLIEYGQKYKQHQLKNEMRAMRLQIEQLNNNYLLTRKDLEMSFVPKKTPKILPLKTTA